MIRILTPLVCICVLATSLIAQRGKEWYRADVWEGPGDAISRTGLSQFAGSKTNETGIRAEAFTPGNIVVCRVGNGTGTLSGNAAPVFLDEFTPDGTFVSTVALPTVKTGANFQLTLSGSSTNPPECQITRSVDRRYIFLGGYVKPVGTSGVSGATGSRVIGRVDAAGAVDTTTVTDSLGSSHFRGVASIDGSGVWTATSAGGVSYLPFGGYVGATTVSNTVNENRAINIFGNQLYTSSRFDTYRLTSVGTGTPTTDSNTMAKLPGYPLSDMPGGFFMADLSDSVAGLDTLYVADEGTGPGQLGGGIKKFSLVTGSWTYNGTFPASSSPSIPANNFVGLTGTVSATDTVTLFATRSLTSGNQLVKFVDATGYNVPPTSQPTLLSTAAANTVYRGVALAPETPASPPTVVTGAATNVTTGTATLNGSANPNGASTTGYFRYSTSDPGSCSDSFGSRAPVSGGTDLGSGSASVDFSQNAVGLLSGTTYYYCAIAQSAGGTSLGSLQSFTTAALPNISIDDVAISEGDSGTTAFTFTVSLSAAAGPGGVTFDIATADGTAQDDIPGTEDEDYIEKSLTAQTIPQGSTTYGFTVSVNGDTDLENNESFFLNITNVTGATVSDGQGTGTILNDDAGPLNFVVTKVGPDANDGVCDADCSLREAVGAANANPGADTITFDPALFAAPAIIDLTGGPLPIIDHVTITGPGADLLTLDAHDASRLFIIAIDVLAEISSVSMTGGYNDAEGGGAIFSEGNLTLRAVHMYGNYGRFGGAIMNYGFGTSLNINDSTIANNTADDAGAIASYGPLRMYNSTISGNTATDFVGAIYIASVSNVSHTILNSTITGNTARSDGGVWVDNPNVEIATSIIAGNSASVGSADFTGNAPISYGYNLIGIVADAAYFTAATDQKGTSATPLDPKLAPLANNGGPVPTHGFDNSGGLSPAIDKGNAFGQTTDARGMSRTVEFAGIANAVGGDGTDIGAYELLAPTAAPVTITGRVLSTAGRPVYGAVVTLTDEGGEPKRAVTNMFGYYRFEGVSGGEGYVLSVKAKRYSFRSVFVNADADVAGLDIYAER